MKTSKTGSKSQRTSITEGTETSKGLNIYNSITPNTNTHIKARENYDHGIECDGEVTAENDWFDAENYNSVSRA